MSQTCLKCLKCLCLVNLLKGPWQWQHLIVVLDKQVPVVAPTQSVSVQIWQQQHLPNSCPWGLPGHWAFCYELRSPLPKLVHIFFSNSTGKARRRPRVGMQVRQQNVETQRGTSFCQAVPFSDDEIGRWHPSKKSGHISNVKNTKKCNDTLLTMFSSIM